MGQSSSPLELAKKLQAFSGQVAAIPAKATREACMEGKTVLLKSLAGVGGVPSLRLRNVGKRGAKLGVQFTVKDDAAGATGTIKAIGPWPLVENNTKAHRIPRERARGKRRVVVIPGVGVRASANHPGTKGKKPWALGAQVIRRQAPKHFQKGVATAMAKTFGGLGGGGSTGPRRSKGDSD